MKRFLCTLALGLALGAQAAPTPAAPAPELAAVLSSYADVVHDTYADTLIAAQAMQRAIHAFLAAPSAETQRAAQETWRACPTCWPPRTR